MSLQRVSIPEGQKGRWRVEHFKTNATDFSSLFSGRAVPVGKTFTRLMRGDTLVMSDTPAEMRDHRAPVWHAKGRCLLNGLGIGMVLKAILAKPEVTHVDVIEKSAEVLELVSPHYTDPRVSFINADAFDYQPPRGVRYGMVWHDIWDYICADNLPEMTRLHRKYGKRTEWQGSWCRYECKRGR